MLAYTLAIKEYSERVIVTLEIPDDADTNMYRLSVMEMETAKHRTDRAKVLKIEDANGIEYTDVTNTMYIYGPIGKYVVGKEISTYVDRDFENTSGSGITFFLSKDAIQSHMIKSLENGVITSYYSNGLKWEELTYADGKKHGVCRGWYESGQLRYEDTYVAGVIQNEDDI